MPELFLLVSFPFLGALLAAIDAAFDRAAFSKRAAFLLAIPTALLFAFTMLSSAPAATILMAVLLSCLLGRKVDNLAFFVGAIIVVAVLYWASAFSFLIAPLIVLTIAGVLDEVGNNYADKNTVKVKFVELFFRYRFFMKIAVLAFALLGAFEMVYFAAFLLFDIAYGRVAASFGGKRQKQ